MVGVIALYIKQKHLPDCIMTVSTTLRRTKEELNEKIKSKVQKRNSLLLALALSVDPF